MKKTLLTLLITLCGAMNTLAQESEGLSINITKVSHFPFYGLFPMT